MRARDWDEEYIYGLAVQEYDDIEFKASPLVDLSTSEGKMKVLDILAKAISALANYGGGFLVLGVKDPKECKQDVLEIVHGGILKEFAKPTSSGKVDTAEWLRQNIANMTEHKLQNYEVHAIEREGESSQIDEGKAVFVIGVPDSPNAPFQSARDNKYYMRVGGNSEPASHRIVMDIMGRRQHPNIQVDFSISIETREKTNLTLQELESDLRTYDVVTFSIRAVNAGRVLAQYVQIEVSLPIKAIPVKGRRKEDVVTIGTLDFQKYDLQNTRRDIIVSELGVHSDGPSWYEPILPGRRRTWNIDLSLDFLERRSLYVSDLSVRWVSFADNASLNEGDILWDNIEIIDRRSSQAGIVPPLPPFQIE